MMQQTRIEFLFQQHFKKTASAEELAEFDAIVEQYSNREEVENLMEKNWDSFTTDTYSLSEADTQRIFQHIIAAQIKAKRMRRLMITKWSVAASLILILGAGIWLFGLHYSGFKTRHDTSHIVAGRNTATLTLAGGEKIMLSDKESAVVVAPSGLKYDDGTAVANRYDSTAVVNRNLVASTPTAGTYQIVLQDGTRVWLNSESKLEFPASFSGLTKRIVRLTGEAYFEVAKVMVTTQSKANKVKVPFIVNTTEEKVEVLGTHFNVCAYADEHDTRTTLLEGSVKVSAHNSSSSGLLKPNQQAVLNHFNQISIKAIDAQTVIDWKNGEFVFNQESLENIMRKVCRWYDVKVIFTNDDIRQQPFSGSVSRFGNISQLITVLESTKLIKFKVEGKLITISPN